MVDGWEHVMTQLFACPDETKALLASATRPDRVHDSTVASFISPDDDSGAYMRHYNGKAM